MEKVENVRRIRNEVMHFDPDGIPEKDLHLQRLQIIDAMNV